MKSEHDFIFGGFASVAYPPREYGTNIDVEDSKAFLFQLHPNQIKLANKQDDKYKMQAIRCYTGCLSLFGGGSDLLIH